MAVCGVSNLCGETLEKARRELNENPDTRQQCIQELRLAIEKKEADPDLEGVIFERKDDPFLLRFLRARKFEQDRALSLYVHYYENKRDYPAIFSEFTPQSVVEILKCGAINVLDGRMNNGTKVICIRPMKWDMDRFPPELMLRSVLLVMDKLLEDEETQVHGISIFQYFQDIEFAQVWRFSQTEAIQKGIFFNILQDGVPIRLKGVHLLLQPWYVSIVLTIARPFMKEKLRQRLNLHGEDFTRLHELIDMRYLPLELDGTLPSLDNYTAVRLFPDLLD